MAKAKRAYDAVTTDRRCGQHVEILGGMAEFIGKTGRIRHKEGGLYRVRLDAPVMVEGVGEVHDDLWESAALKTLPATRKPKGAMVVRAVRKQVEEIIDTNTIEGPLEPPPAANSTVDDAPSIEEAMLGPGPGTETPAPQLPTPPNFAAKRKSLQARLAQLVALAESGDLDGLMSVDMLPPNATSPKQLHRYRNAAVAALKQRGLPR
jgi:hypothetical protein